MRHSVTGRVIQREMRECFDVTLSPMMMMMMMVMIMMMMMIMTMTMAINTRVSVVDEFFLH